jgi:RNA polymerase sigma factor for flagellar operon FliA
MAAAANRWFKPHEWAIPLRSWSLREQVRSLFVAPNTTGRKGPKMKLRNTTESIPNQGAAREAAILQDLDLVNKIARRFQRRLPPCVTFDDLASAGMLGLIQAVDRFDQTRGLKFKTYAQHRIWGAMQDFLRDEDPLSRTERRRVRASAPALSATGYGIPGATVSLDQIPMSRLASPAQPAFMLRSEVREARRCLSPRENRVIQLLYDFDWKSREVAVELHVNESRVSQIKQRAIAKLRLQLEPRNTRRAA